MGQRYYLEQSPLVDAAEIILDGPEAQHLIKVMRAKAGTVIEYLMVPGLNGKHGLWMCGAMM